MEINTTHSWKSDRKRIQSQGWLSWKRTLRKWGSMDSKRSPQRRQLCRREGQQKQNALTADASYKDDGRRNPQRIPELLNPQRIP